MLHIVLTHARDNSPRLSSRRPWRAKASWVTAPVCCWLSCSSAVLPASQTRRAPLWKPQATSVLLGWQARLHSK